MKIKKASILLTGLLLILSACGNGEENNTAEEEGPFTIGVIPAQTVGEMQGAMDQLQNVISEELDREVEVSIYPDYNGVVEAMNYEQIDMAYLGPLTYVIAEQNGGAKAIITLLVDGEPYYHSYIITHTDNTQWDTIDQVIENPEEIDFAFGDHNSTSGSLIPSMYLREQGVFESEQDHEFNSVRFTGSHDATALSVQNKQVEAGAVDSAIYNQLIEAGSIDEEQLKIVWESEELFQYPWAVHENTDDETIERLQEIFVGIDDPVILDAFGASGFTEASSEDYESIRQAAIQQGIITE